MTIISNFDLIEPTKSVKRWQKKKVDKKKSTFQEGKHVTFQQPGLFNTYNKFMGEVNLHDNAVQNYRIGIRGKKWYDPL